MCPKGRILSAVNLNGIYPNIYSVTLSFYIHVARIILHYPGKSNLMDAVSFVLGEKTSNLRVRSLKVRKFSCKKYLECVNKNTAVHMPVLEELL